ncbi:tetratricopeptide repeat protein [Telmatospirillum sp.]|uniref:tetratricopeptide repeat protein n=1 Tax=Telmatospirillum sp. TaxID=2079197 RepID=UPI002851DEF8|nr:hypothetical protein [Telmatospirillum sp.]MDR3436065.1 hypothetical protein [Telmatospirillum sp.]
MTEPTCNRFTCSQQPVQPSKALRAHWLEQVRTMFRQGNFESCIGRCQSILGLAGKDVDILHLLGVAEVKSGSVDEGLTALAEAQRLAPDDAALCIDYAMAHGIAGHLDEAITILTDACVRHPSSPDLASHLAEVLSDADRLDDVHRVLKHAIAQTPAESELYCLLAANLASDLKTEEALVLLNRALCLDPNDSRILTNLGVLYQALGDIDTATTYYLRATVDAVPNKLAQINLALTYLIRSNLAEGFAMLENRFGESHIRIPPSGLPRWRGQPLLNRHLLVTAEQGYGDMIQYARFLHRLAPLGGKITVECQPGLERLLATIPCVEATVTLGNRFPSVDYTVPLLSLPYVLGCPPNLLNDTIPYLPVSEEPGYQLPDRGKLKIGVVWAGRPASGDVYVRRSLNRRTCPLRELAPIMTIPGIDFFSLQMGDAVGQIAETGFPLTNLAPHITDFYDTALFMRQMDLVISIDTAAAHLAGAIGVPLWVLLSPGQTDYRWGTRSPTTPWYPRAQLFRAARSGWTSAIAPLATSLAELVVQQKQPSDIAPAGSPASKPKIQ